MSKTRSFLSFLVIAFMLFMIAMTGVFVYSSINLKDRIIYRTVHQTELVSDVISRATTDLMGAGHSWEKYLMLLNYGSLVGVNSIGIYRLTGEEAFSDQQAPGEGGAYFQRRAIDAAEKESFRRAIRTLSGTEYFNYNELTFSKFVPLKSEGPCASCHAVEGRPLGVLVIRLSTENDFELLEYVQGLIWKLGLIALFPVGALLVASAIIKEKNRLFEELKESNSSLQKTYDELNKTRHNLQLILDNSRVIIITTDTQGRILEFNREAEAILEYSKDEVVGKDVLFIYNDPEQKAAMMNRGKPIDNGVWEVRNREVVLKSKSGKLYHVILTLSTIVDDQGRILGTVGVGKDISEQKMLQFKLLQSEKLAGIGTLASGIAHEINNPLAAILGMAEAIRDEEDVGLVRSYTKDIVQYAMNANRIVKELSVYSRAAHTEQRERVDVSAVIRNALNMARHTASTAHLQVDYELGMDCVIQANPVEVQQVFVNLIVNAIHAMEGKEGGRLSLRCWKEGTFVIALVSDTGCGIPEENLGKIYDPFFTTKPTGKGTGLGLYVVYRLVTKHSGTIDVRSEPGKGTSFLLKFPYGGAEEGLRA